jgi:endonuclease/exonuclease/phosphatase family metal-dependent hydrolase
MGTIRFVGVLSLFTLSLLFGCASEPQSASDPTRPQNARSAQARLVSLTRPVTSLGVMTVNLWHKDRPGELKAVAEQLRADPRIAPDFIVCQEVVFGRSGTEKSTADVLAKELGYHARGTKRTSDREGIAIVSRYPFAWYDERHLEAQTSRLLLGFNRVSVMGEFFVPGAGRVRVVNVHFTNWGFEKRIRVKQLEETLAWVAQREATVPAAITFLGGDFNAEPDSDEIQMVMNFKGPRGMRWRSFNDPQVPSKGSPGRPDKRIDYIFVADAAPAPTLAFAGERLLWKDGVPRSLNGNSKFYLSDHVPVLHRYAVDRASTVVTRVE